MKDKIEWNELKLRKANNDLDKLVQKILDGTIRDDTAKATEDKIYQDKEDTAKRLELLKNELSTLPEVKDVKEHAEMLRQFFLKKYGKERSLARFKSNKMNYQEKAGLIHYLFSGKDANGRNYGIYIKRIDKKKWDIEIYASLDYMNALWKRIILNCQKIQIH